VRNLNSIGQREVGKTLESFRAPKIFGTQLCVLKMQYNQVKTKLGDFEGL